MNSMRTSRVITRALASSLALTAALLVAGCSSSETETAAPTPAASDVPATPSPEGEPGASSAATEAAKTEARKSLADPANVTGIPDGFPRTVPLPQADLISTDVLGNGQAASWIVTYEPTAAKDCGVYADALEVFGYQVVAHDTTTDQGYALRGSTHDITVLCGADGFDVVVNPSISVT
jgi:hypothetical protein